jgi:hypothetical protein
MARERRKARVPPGRTDPAAAEERIRRVLAAKSTGAADYWLHRGKERFARELAEDGVPPDEIAALLERIDGELFPVVNLDDVLRRLVARHAQAE